MSDHSPKSVYIHGATLAEQYRLSKLNDLLNKRCLLALQLEGGEKILDVGSGLGQFSLAMAQKIGKKGAVIGIERNEAQLSTAKALVANSPQTANIEFRSGNAYALPLSKNEWASFDLVHTRFLLMPIKS